jgi:hypothetical protein
MTVTHTALAAGRWHTMTLSQQMGNVGSEYGRAQRWKQSGDEARFGSASDRLLELLDLTLSDPRWRGLRLQEIARVREAICEELFGASTGQSFEKYFLEFAIAARA